MPTSRPYHTYLIDSLKNPLEAGAYLAAVLEDGCLQEINLALANIAEAQGHDVHKILLESGWALLMIPAPLTEADKQALKQLIDLTIPPDEPQQDA